LLVLLPPLHFPQQLTIADSGEMCPSQLTGHNSVLLLQAMLVLLGEAVLLDWACGKAVLTGKRADDYLLVPEDTNHAPCDRPETYGQPSAGKTVKAVN
jgi:hypothetical protein